MRVYVPITETAIDGRMPVPPDGVRSPRISACRIVRVPAAFIVLATAGCRSPSAHREAADRHAYAIIARQQEQLFGQPEPFRVNTPERQIRKRLLLDQGLPSSFPGSAGIHDIERHQFLPEEGYFEASGNRPEPPWLKREVAADQPFVVALDEALQIAARNSPAYRREKERVFMAALDLDFERDAFRSTWQGIFAAEIESDRRSGEARDWNDTSAMLTAGRALRGGAEVTARLGLNLVQIINGGGGSSMGIFGDASISMPLLRGASRITVTEPLTQAERNVVYALYEFEHFKRMLAVRVESEYLGVLERHDRVRIADENYRGLVAAAGRARRLADMGRLPEMQVDQAVQDELRARERWVSARQALVRAEDGFKLTLGLPVDALVQPDPGELEALARLIDDLLDERRQDPFFPESPPPADGSGALGEHDALLTAFENRLDLRVAIGRIADAQRRIAVAADALKADFRLTGNLAAGERRGLGTVGEANARLQLDQGVGNATLTFRPPWNRRRERNQYRERWIALEQAVRDAQQLEDQIKFEIRDRRRVMIEAREAVRIQARALETARRRVRSTDLFLEQGRAQIRDLLDARESLVSAENALTAAAVRYRLAALEYRRDLGMPRVRAHASAPQYEEQALPDR